MRRTFSNGSQHDTRDIDIEIKDGMICFYFTEQYHRQKQWIQEEIERRGEDDLDEDEKGNHEFYWFASEEWEKDKTQRLDRGDNWHTHMKEKNWFTEDMANFLNKHAK